MTNRLWVSGYRAFELNVFKDTDPKVTIIKNVLTAHLTQALDDGMQWLVTGGEQGIEAWSLQVATALKSDYPGLQTALMRPFSDFGHQWQEASQAALAERIEQADFSASVFNHPYENPHQLRAYTDFMLRHTDGALMVYDPDYPGKSRFAVDAMARYAERHDYPISFITVSDLEEAATEYQENHTNNDFQTD